MDERLMMNQLLLPTYLNISITLDPPMNLPADNSNIEFRADRVGSENASVLQKAKEWSELLKKSTKGNRTFQVFGENIEGNSVLLSRFLWPLAPPRELEVTGQNYNVAHERVARFVSMIPFINDLNLFKGLPDIFTTCQEFLDLGGGDYEEHAILLANYFIYIDE
jgi:coiled-coil and C2 domain-containing protein 2A